LLAAAIVITALVRLSQQALLRLDVKQQPLGGTRQHRIRGILHGLHPSINGGIGLFGAGNGGGHFCGRCKHRFHLVPLSFRRQQLLNSEGLRVAILCQLQDGCGLAITILRQVRDGCGLAIAILRQLQDGCGLVIAVLRQLRDGCGLAIAVLCQLRNGPGLDAHCVLQRG